MGLGEAAISGLCVSMLTPLHLSCDGHPRDRDRAQRGRSWGDHAVLSVASPKTGHIITPPRQHLHPGPPILTVHHPAVSSHQHLHFSSPVGPPDPWPLGSPVQPTPVTTFLSRSFLSLHKWPASTKPTSIGA